MTAGGMNQKLGGMLGGAKILPGKQPPPHQLEGVGEHCKLPQCGPEPRLLQGFLAF